MLRTLQRSRRAALLMALGAGVLAVACASSEQAVRPDTEVTAAVTSRLAAAPEINSFTLEVATRDGIVTLSGTVPTSAARIEAERLTRATEGVRGVINLLEVDGFAG
jgi:osmotically-inducible protein OsmY